MLKNSAKTRFVVPLLAMVLALAFAPAAFAATITAGEIGEGDDPSAPFGPGKDFENAEITFDSGQTFVYTGKEVKPKVSVWLANSETGKKELLTQDTDYKLSYKKNLNAGKAYVVAWCQDEEHMYTVTKNFTIAKAPLSKTKVKIGKKPYTGKKLTPTPKITYKGMTLKKGTDFKVAYKKNKNAGLATAIIRGVAGGNYKGRVEKSFRIMKASLNDVKISKIGSKVYTGSPIKPAVKAKYKGIALKANKDYTVKYKDNIDAGTATVTIKGKGNFRAKRILEFTINPAPISKCDVSYQKSWYWNGGLIKPELTVTYKGKKLTQGKDYLVGYANNSDVGTAQITIQGKGNFTGTDKYDFKINLLPLTDSSVSTTPANGALYNYTGSPVLPMVTVKVSSGGKTYVISPDYYDVFYKHGNNYYTESQARAQNLFKGSKAKDKIYYIRVQAKEGSKFFTSHRNIQYTVLKPADQTK